MKKIIKSLNEEMDRIKSLFTEERMFGNLVEQGEETTDDEKGGVVDKALDKVGLEREKVGEKSAQSKGSTWKPIDAKKDLETNYLKDKEDSAGLKYLGLELDRVDTINDKSKCRKHLDTMIKLTQKGMTRDNIEHEKNGEDYLDRVNWCVNRFSNEFEKEGFLKKGSKIRIMMDTLGLEMTAEMKKKMGDEQEVDPEGVYDADKGEIGQSDTGIEGEKYDVKDENGNVIGIIKKTDNNKYRFRSKKGYPILDKSDKGNPKFRDLYLKYFYKAINADPTKYRIKIQKSFEKDNLDMGTFVLVSK